MGGRVWDKVVAEGVLMEDAVRASPRRALPAGLSWPGRGEGLLNIEAAPSRQRWGWGVPGPGVWCTSPLSRRLSAWPRSPETPARRFALTMIRISALAAPCVECWLPFGFKWVYIGKPLDREGCLRRLIRRGLQLVKPLEVLIAGLKIGSGIG